jgi:cellulose synthase/poly-beta-1,6-N-acetylglucosamine synthase-like glycosyltransferase
MVMADNCADQTVDVATSAGAEVVETVRNRAKKAGALNQGLRRLLERLMDDDLVLIMDADSHLSPDFIENGIRRMQADTSVGALSGSYYAREDPSYVGLMQRVEFVQGLRGVHRRGGRVHVLSGAAGIFRVAALRTIAQMRGTVLPGVKGWVYHQESLTEDYELTVALKRLGYRTRCASDCAVITDVMTNWHDWGVQRLRWQRGTLETLYMYGWVPHTRKTWAVLCWTYFRSLVPFMMLAVWAYAILFEGVSFHWFWVAIIPVFILDQVVCSWRAGTRARVYAALIVPMWIYDMVHATVYWKALLLSLRGTDATWVT